MSPDLRNLFLLGSLERLRNEFNVVILNSVNDPLISRDFLPLGYNLGEAARRIIANIM